MCNCYNHKCEKCETVIPMHLEDYETRENEIKVFCHEHIPKRKGIRIYVLEQEHRETLKMRFGEIEGNNTLISEIVLIFCKGYRIGIQDLTKNAKEHKWGNHPNICEAELLRI